jgi:hypothetical protein
MFLDNLLRVRMPVPKEVCQRIVPVGGSKLWPVRPDGILDGTWFICETLTPCDYVFSFGLGFDWSFDEEMSTKYGCSIHSFDPSMDLNSHVHQPGNVNFEPIALGPQDGIIDEPMEPLVSWRPDKRTPQRWQMQTLKTIWVNRGRPQITVLKIDIEGFEWSALETAIHDGTMHHVNQLLIEIHFMSNELKKIGGIVKAVKILKALESIGFQLVRSGINPLAKDSVFDTFGKKLGNIKSCYELTYIRIPSKINIPLQIFQTSKSSIPQYRVHKWKEQVDSYVYMNDAQGQDYLTTHWGSRYTKAFKSIASGAIRADFLRLCYMAENGGFYIDSDMCAGNVSLQSLRTTGTELIIVPQTSFSNADIVVWNSFFGVIPKHPIMMQLVNTSLSRIEQKMYINEQNLETATSIAGGRLMRPLLDANHSIWLETAIKYRDEYRISPHVRTTGKRRARTQVRMDITDIKTLYNQTVWVKNIGPVAYECPRNWNKRIKQLTLKDPNYWFTQVGINKGIYY